MKDIQKLDNAAAERFLAIQQQFYEHGSSFVLYALQPGVRMVLTDLDLLELLNHTPTESEAMDIVQMEEIERELGDIEEI